MTKQEERMEVIIREVTELLGRKPTEQEVAKYVAMRDELMKSYIRSF